MNRMPSHRDTSNDYDVLVAKMRAALDDVPFAYWPIRSPLPTRFREENMMTPNFVAHLNLNGECVEVSQGYGFRHEHLYGVTFPNYDDDRSSVFFDVTEVVRHLKLCGDPHAAD